MTFRDFLEDGNPTGWSSDGDWYFLARNDAPYASKKIRSKYVASDGQPEAEPRNRKTPEEIMGVSKKKRRMS